MDDELDPKPKNIEKPDLEIMSLEELNEYIAEMEAEIERVKAMIESKTSHRGAADSIFRN